MDKDQIPFKTLPNIVSMVNNIVLYATV